MIQIVSVWNFVKDSVDDRLEDAIGRCREELQDSKEHFDVSDVAKIFEKQLCLTNT